MSDHVLAAALIVTWGAAGTSAFVSAQSRRLGLLVLGATLIGTVAVATGWAGRTWVSTVASTTLIAAAAHVLLALPRGRLETRGRRLAAAAYYVVAVGGGVVCWGAFGSVSAGVAATGWVAFALASIPAAHQRYVVSTAVERHWLQWLGLGALAATEVALVVGTGHLLTGWPRSVPPFALAGTGLLPAGLAAGIRTGPVMRVDRIVTQALAAVTLTLIAAAVYVVLVLGLGGAPNDDAHRALGLSLAAAGVVALGFAPVRARVRETTHRLVFGDRSPADDVLRTFSSRLTRALPLEELLLQLAESLRTTMTLTSAEVFMGSAEVMDRAAAAPDRGPGTITIGPRERAVLTSAGVSGAAWVSVWLPDLLDGRQDSQLRVAPVVNSGALLGLIVVERPSDGDPFSAEDDRVLTDLARQAGLALHNVELDSALQASLDEIRRQAEELRRSRTRIVATADAERRKIERDLHDGAQQRLVALAVSIRLLRDTVDESAREMVDALITEVRETIQEVRDLAHGIYPPLLVDSGLREALRAAASRSSLDVSVQSDDIGRYPPEVEAAVYFCCLEAMQNAAKHAPNATVEIAVREEESGLVFDVIDDGPGFDPVIATKGHGFVNMSDRLGAIGGSVRWESALGAGARVRGVVPLGPDQAPACSLK